MSASYLTDRQILRLWWAFLWRFLLATFVLSAAVGAITAVITLALPIYRVGVQMVANALYALSFAPASLWSIKRLAHQGTVGPGMNWRLG